MNSSLKEQLEALKSQIITKKGKPAPKPKKEG